MTLPQFFEGFKAGFKGFVENLAIIINIILLSVVYLVAVGITSIIAKIARKHFLDIKCKKKSYWIELNLKKKTTEEYYRQF